MATHSKGENVSTKQVYQYDETLRKHLTRITSTQPFSSCLADEQALFRNANEQTQVVETAETIFYVQGGGQPSDTGRIVSKSPEQKAKCFIVEAVRYGTGGRILHFGYFEGDGSAFEGGEMVEQCIDGSKRDLNSRIHTAGHIIGLAVRNLASTSNPELDVTELKAQHYPGASFVEFKGIIDGKYKDAIQSQAVKYVTDALPVKLHWFKPEELSDRGVITAEGMPIIAGADGKVRVVDIIGAGAYPCGGTHVPDCSLVGELIVKNIKRQKGISKVSYAVNETTSSV